VGGDPVAQKKTAKDIAVLAKEWGVDAIISGNGG
jgi:pyruvate-formate lyase-activating enzyme